MPLPRGRGQTSVRLAACEPCRKAKLACGHERPACTRCHNRGRSDGCVYRSRPFRRKIPRNGTQRISIPRIPPSASPPTEPPLQAHSSPRDISIGSSQPRHYPNPGFLGISSHSTIFHQVSCAASDNISHHPNDAHPAGPSTPIDVLNDQTILNRAVHTLSRLDHIDIPKLTCLVRAWTEKGVNLPLAEPLVGRCSDAVLAFMQPPIPSTTNSMSQRARSLLANTHKPISVRKDSTAVDFFSQIFGDNMRWESLGIFFTAASRAVLDTSSYTPLYINDEQRYALAKPLTYMGDCCLETCLALDCLNDLQLVLQYENLIVHSQLDGDQSMSTVELSPGQLPKMEAILKLDQGYHSWRRMGDVASSLFALGYHEKIDEDVSNIPPFVAELRKACFARIYAADKSLAIFLGRPPRIIKDYCYFQIPDNLLEVWAVADISAKDIISPVPSYQMNYEGENTELNNREVINYLADTRCSARFGLLKEEVLQLFRKRHSGSIEASLSELRAKVHKEWEELPAHFRLATNLKDCHHRPFERDFLAGTRLDYLHILFLLNLVSQRRIPEPDESLLLIASEMLSLTVEVIILRDRLVNSGTCLIWKVAQYGLPAAGIVSLALLKSHITSNTTLFSRPKMMQNLSVLVAEINIGAWIQAGEPNFALFMRATRTIQSLLDSLTAWKTPVGTLESPTNLTDFPEDWDPYANFQSWEFEEDFWASLAEHPTLHN